ncbi:metal-dependent hydrolase [Halosimplex aquaticum]|uniref:Metal-dependent hydrolase n=2 Tax=Halosimplex aquaticum TaxID=3026162 RepID=A0ABD5Y0T8_9EURY
MGHLAMGLLWALPAWWLLWDEHASALFVVFAVLMAPFPDVDTFLSTAFPNAVHHHGVTHTIVFVVTISVVAGAIVAATLTDRIDDWTAQRFETGRTFVFATVAFAVGGLSHVFADMLSAPDISTPIEPLWPFFEGSLGIDVLYYNNPWWNVGFLSLMIVVHLVVAYSAFDRRGASRTGGA